MPAMLMLAGVVMPIALRHSYRRFTRPVRQAEAAREARLRAVLADAPTYVGAPLQRLIDLLGPPATSTGMDFGVAVLCWRANAVCIHAYVRSDVCDAIERHVCGPGC